MGSDWPQVEMSLGVSDVIVKQLVHLALLPFRQLIFGVFLGGLTGTKRASREHESVDPKRQRYEKSDSVTSVLSFLQEEQQQRQRVPSASVDKVHVDSVDDEQLDDVEQVAAIIIQTQIHKRIVSAFIHEVDIDSVVNKQLDDVA